MTLSPPPLAAPSRRPLAALLPPYVAMLVEPTAPALELPVSPHSAPHLRALTPAGGRVRAGAPCDAGGVERCSAQDHGPGPTGRARASAGLFLPGASVPLPSQTPPLTVDFPHFTPHLSPCILSPPHPHLSPHALCPRHSPKLPTGARRLTPWRRSSLCPTTSFWACSSTRAGPTLAVLCWRARSYPPSALPSFPPPLAPLCTQHASPQPPSPPHAPQHSVWELAQYPTRHRPTPADFQYGTLERRRQRAHRHYLVAGAVERGLQVRGMARPDHQVQPRDEKGAPCPSLPSPPPLPLACTPMHPD